MEESQDYVKIEGDIRKIRYNLENTKMEISRRLLLLNILRYYTSLIEDRDKVEKVVYNEEEKKLDYAESIEIGIAIALNINDAIRNESDLGKQQELYKAMKETYYYLARYLFEYYLPAMEFGIAPEKQFIAPRTMVLNRIAKEMSKFYYRKDRPIMTLSMPQGTGKEQPLSSKILTPTGWITMGEVKVGTKVIGADGKACEVVGVYPKGVKDVYRVSFDDGSFVDCGLEHLWEVQTRADRSKEDKKRIVNTKEMLKNFKIVDKYHTYNNYSIRLVEPIEFKYKEKINENDIKPYILGTLIANGSLTSKTLSFSTGEKDVIEKIKEKLPQSLKITETKKQFVYVIRKAQEERDKLGHFLKNEYLLKIEEYGLYGKKSNKKFIPKKYLYANRENRIELLKGLMDGDGHITKEGWCIYNTTSEELKDDFLELVRGLGGKASFSKKKAGYKNKEGIYVKCNDVYQINFSIKILPVEVKKKKNRYKNPNYNYQKMITNIYKVRKEECQCIMIDHPEHLYVTDGYTLTHNTEVSKRFLSWTLGKNPEKPSIFVSYSASIAKDKGFNGIDALIHDDMGNYSKIFPHLHELYRSAQDMVLDFSNDPNRKRPHSEYSMYFVGFDGSITGRTRAHNILYADDLVKDIEEASNKDIMDKKWVEFTGTLKKRMQGNCKMLLVGTMFSINDPLSRTIQYYKEHEPERLMTIRIPGLDENDESNFNYKYGYAITTEMFHEDRNLMDPVSFSCLIQQNPIEREGLLFFENEFKKYDLSRYEKMEGYQRTVSACDVAWGGEDHLSMPIVDEYENGDCYLVKWYFVKGTKEETIPMVVQYIITYGISHICFEANNGGDMYADEVKRRLKEAGYNKCYVESKKSPTNKSKTDRILAQQGFIKGADSSDYRLIIPTRESIKEDKMFNEALNEVFAFNQSSAKNVRTKQHDDAPDSISMLGNNVLGAKSSYGKATSNISREMLGI